MSRKPQVFIIHTEAICGVGGYEGYKIKKRDYVQLLWLSHSGTEYHLAFCEPINEIPEDLYWSDSLIEVGKIERINNHIELEINGIEGRGWEFRECPWKKIKNLRLRVVNEPYEKIQS